MTDHIVEQTANAIHEHFNACRGRGGVSPLRLAEALQGEGVLRPEITDEMVERGAEAFQKAWNESIVAMGEGVETDLDHFLSIPTRAALEAALGGDAS